MLETKMYLADSVYADIERGMVILYTDNGDGPKNKIYLETEVVLAFLKWWNRMRGE